MAGVPYIKFYPGDWLRDDVSACSLAAQGLWLRMMLVAHDSANYGFLEINGSPMPHAMIARKCGCGLAEFEELFAELESAGVPSRASNGSVYSRRMARDGEQKRKNSKKRSEAGKAGADARWHDGEKWQTDGKSHGKKMANAISNEWQNDAYSYSYSHSDSEKERPPPPEIENQKKGDDLTFLCGKDPNFVAWLNSYPEFKRIGSAKCLKIWPYAILEIQQEIGCDEAGAITHLMQRTALFAASWKGKSTRFCWNAATFLEESHWSDPVSAWDDPDSEKTPAKSKMKSVDEINAERRKLTGGKRL